MGVGKPESPRLRTEGDTRPTFDALAPEEEEVALGPGEVNGNGVLTSRVVVAGGVEGTLSGATGWEVGGGELVPEVAAGLDELFEGAEAAGTAPPPDAAPFATSAYVG